MNLKKIKKILKKTWHFIWEEDSIESWVVNIILAFVLIKFIIFPVLGLVMGTNYPIVAVVSGSMEHKAVHPCIGYTESRQCAARNKEVYELCGNRLNEKIWVDHDAFWENCGSFYEEKDITKEEFMDFDFSRGFNTGDIIILKGTSPKNIEIGDVIVFQATQPYPIIHRIVEKRLDKGLVFATKGDHNSIQTMDDLDISEDRVLGKAIIRVPYLGWIKIGFFKALDKLGILKLANYINARF